MSERMTNKRLEEIRSIHIDAGGWLDGHEGHIQRSEMLDEIDRLLAEVERLKQPEYFWLESDPEWAADDIAELIYESGELSAGEECFVDICGARNTGTVRHKVTAKKGRFGLDYEIEALKEAGDD